MEGIFRAVAAAKDFETGISEVLTAARTRAARALDQARNIDPDYASVKLGSVSLFLFRNKQTNPVGARLTPTGPDSHPRPSSTMWNEVRQRKATYVLETSQRMGGVLNRHGIIVVGPGVSANANYFSMSLPDTPTHVMAVPTITSGTVDGLITLEVWAPSFLEDFPDRFFTAIAAEFEEIAALIVPPLRALPLTRPPTVAQPAWAGAAMRDPLAMLDLFADTDEPLLIIGGPGTGKSWLARHWVHQRSNRRSAPFETVGLGAYDRDGLLAALCGWSQPRSDNNTRRIVNGALARARGGTIFLDDIHLASKDAQAALHRIISDGFYKPILSEQILEVDVRFIAASSVDLQHEVESGRFLRELYGRIGGLRVLIPEMDERQDEIEAWLYFFARDVHTRMGGMGTVHIDPAAMHLLKQRSWPFNLNELKQIMERAYPIARSRLPVDGGDISITVESLPPPERDPNLEHRFLTSLRHTAELMAELADLRFRLAEPTIDLTPDSQLLRSYTLQAAVRRYGITHAGLSLGYEPRVRAGTIRTLVRNETDRASEILERLGLTDQPIEG